jgi:septum formation protein
VDESAFGRNSIAAGHDAAKIALGLATEKARYVARLDRDAIVLGADQILRLDGEMINKCGNADEANLLLRRLRGRTHDLVTAAALVADGVELWSYADVCRMTMRNFSDAYLDEYASGAGAALTQCVGCYEFEGPGAQLFERAEGDFYSILGLPLLPVLAALREHGVIAR